MGTETTPLAVDGTVIPASDVNTLSAIFKGDQVPRNSGGVPEAKKGSVGTVTTPWLKAFIESGYWTMGDIKPHHSYNGSSPIGEGWMLCDGRVINETNYDTEHGSGAWAEFVITSGIDGKYLPNLVDKYLTGVSATTQSGGSAITTVGNTSSTVNIQHTHSHSHTVDSHNHQWYNSTQTTTTNDQLYNSSGALVNLSSPYTKISGAASLLASTNSAALADAYTANRQPGTSTATVDGAFPGVSPSAMSVKPESIEVQYYMRVI